jgi:hypothetical protein
MEAASGQSKFEVRKRPCAGVFDLIFGVNVKDGLRSGLEAHGHGLLLNLVAGTQGNSARSEP